MRVRLKVLQGSNAGRELNITKADFVIGRKEGCHLRPRSDLISRKHCVIATTKSGVVVRDLKSRNGTFVNDERVEGERELKLGDLLKVGKFEFEVIIDHTLGGSKMPEPKDVKEVAARTTAAAENKGGEVSDWLEEADEVERERRQTDPATRQYKLDETDRVDLEQASKETISGADPETADDTKIETPDDKKKGKEKKKEPGKLPQRPGLQTDNSRDAAAQVLKDFFNRR